MERGSAVRQRIRIELENANTISMGGEETYGAGLTIDPQDDSIDLDIRGTLPSFKFGAVEVPPQEFNMVMPLHEALDAIGYLIENGKMDRRLLPLDLRGTG